MHITCPFMYRASGGGGVVTNNLSHVVNVGVSYSQYHADGMINATQSIIPHILLHRGYSIEYTNRNFTYCSPISHGYQNRENTEL